MVKIALVVFLTLKTLTFIFERFLSWLNRHHREQVHTQQEACAYLNISPEDLRVSMNYAEDKYRFGFLNETFDFALLILIVASGTLGLFDDRLATLTTNPTLKGLLFFALLGFFSALIHLPFQYYYTFVLEGKHGFNRQTQRAFWLDQLKMLAVAVVLGGPFLFALLWVMQHMGATWWLWAWGIVVFFSIFSIWIYPTWIAPLFNRFSPLPEGELKEQILSLSDRVGFKTRGLSVMDASKRSSHGNAYFTGVFGEKKIVLFDTLVQMLSTPQIVAVLAHELGHFKLHHIRNALFRSIFFTGVIFYILKILLPIEAFYRAFGFSNASPHAALVVFSLWFGPIELFIKPFASFISRQNEFAADAFAKKTVGDGKSLSEALLTMREKSHIIPITHPLFSLFYFSHPPIIERLKKLRE